MFSTSYGHPLHSWFLLSGPRLGNSIDTRVCSTVKSQIYTHAQLINGIRRLNARHFHKHIVERLLRALANNRKRPEVRASVTDLVCLFSLLEAHASLSASKERRV